MNTIYKFMKFREDYFDNFMLKASRYGEFNDPFDLVLGSYGASLPKKERKEFYRSLYLFSDPLWHQENYLNIQAGARASVAVICFTESYKNLLMWTHYADNHTGICVGYDYNCEFFHGKYSCDYYKNVGKIRKVTYTQDRPTYSHYTELVSDTDKWFIKSEEWKNEKEHRILLPIDNAFYSDDLINNSTLIYLFEIEPKYIKKVILGCRMEESNKEYIYEKLSGYDIKIIEAVPDHVHYKLTFSRYVLNNDSKLNRMLNLGMDI